MALPDAVRRWLRLWDGVLDLDEYLAVFAEDVTFFDAQSGRSGRGRDQLAEVARPFTQLSGISMALSRYAANGDDVFLEIELDAKAPSGDSVQSRGAVVFTVSGSEISSLTAYLFRQNIDL